MSEPESGLTSEQSNGCYVALLLFAVLLIAIGLGYVFGPGVAFLAVGVTVFWRVLHVRKAEKAKKTTEESKVSNA
jgi:hypothetical protein